MTPNPGTPQPGLFDLFTRQDQQLADIKTLLVQSNKLLAAIATTDMGQQQTESVLRSVQDVPLVTPTPNVTIGLTPESLGVRRQGAQFSSWREIVNTLLAAGLAHLEWSGYSTVLAAGSTPATGANNRHLYRLRATTGSVGVLWKLYPYAAQEGVVNINVFWDPEANDEAGLPQDASPSTADIRNHYLCDISKWVFAEGEVPALPSKTARSYITKSIGLTYSNTGIVDVYTNVFFIIMYMREEVYNRYIGGFYKEQMKWLEEELKQ